MRFTGFSFGFIRVDGVTYDHDLVIDRGKIRKRKKAARGKYRAVHPTGRVFLRLITPAATAAALIMKGYRR